MERVGTILHMHTSEVTIVAAWHDALNTGDADRLALSSEAIEMGGPRGIAQGAQLLREWVDRAGIRLELLRVFHRDGTVVAEERARWRSAATGQQPTDSQDVASVFVIRDGRVVRVVRYDRLAAALEAAGLDESHELRRSGAADPDTF